MNPRLEALIEASPLAVFELDVDGRVRLWNGAAERILGWRSEDVLGRPLPVVFESGEDGQGAECQGVTEFEAVCRRKDGSPIAISVSTAPVRDGEDVVIGSVTFLADVTERKRLEEVLVQAQKMEAVGRLAGGIAHDFNNLLLVIRSYASLLGTRLGAPTRKEIEEIEKATDRAARLVRQLLAFSRRRVVEPTAVDLNAMIADMENTLRPLLGEDVELAIVSDPGLDRVRADGGQIEQVLVNLVVNARDAMPGGGRVTVETRNIEVEAGRSLGNGHPGPGAWAAVAVSDTGIGMDSETESHIFEPFFTTKMEGRGTGLGLSIVAEIVAQSGGHIGVSSEPRRGATFTIYLPRVDEPRQVDEPMRAAERSRARAA